MILLDTNYLVLALVPGSKETEEVLKWTIKGQDLCTSAVCWYEFLCGPVNQEGIGVIRSLLKERILPMDANHAAEAARLFNATGRQRRLRVDAMIAAAAILSNATLATNNLQDFSEFLPWGLKLVPGV